MWRGVVGSLGVLWPLFVMGVCVVLVVGRVSGACGPFSCVLVSCVVVWGV